MPRHLKLSRLQRGALTKLREECALVDRIERASTMRGMPLDDTVARAIELLERDTFSKSTPASSEVAGALAALQAQNRERATAANQLAIELNRLERTVLLAQLPILAAPIRQ